jgi:hypothetical protein
MFKYFYGSLFVLFIGLFVGLLVGGWTGVYLVGILAVLEISLSFDNAVVNAKVLENMDPKWRKRFIIFGIPIAVFGMRLIFPIALVAMTTTMGFIDVSEIAVNNPEAYRKALLHGFPMIAAFGGSFLLMVFMDFFFDNDREVRWIKSIENNKAVIILSDISNIELVIASIVGVILTYSTQSYKVAIAFSAGVILHSLLNIMDEFFSPDENRDSSSLSNIARSGIIGFIYLEVLDASFSFDGVIGAFAISMNIFIIMLGLGIGAMFVRSLTIYFVENKTLKEFVYLEHGAHYAIGFLAFIMFIKIFVEIPEWITGTIGIIFIVSAFIHSHFFNKKSLIR